VIDLNIKKLAITASIVLALSACQQDKQDSAEQGAATDKAGIDKADTHQSKTSGGVKDEDKIGYALGAKMATFILTDTKQYDLKNFNKESVSKGFNDALLEKSKLTEQEIQEQFAIFQQQIQAAQQQAAVVAQEKHGVESEKAKTDGAAYLAENGKKDGVTTTKSGLQYSVITAGAKDGTKPKATDVVQVHYTGKFIDGNTFDSSVERGQPATFPLNRVVAGWTEGLQLMVVGSKYHFVIPGDLAYGPNGRPGSIPGNSVLQFDVELLAINPDDKAAESSKTTESTKAVKSTKAADAAKAEDK